MSYINVGAFIDGYRPKSKKALREALRDAPETVRFDGTSSMGDQFDGFADSIPEGISLTVAGPDPYTKRSWFATVTRSAEGKVKIT
jgi:hypothetical protein